MALHLHVPLPASWKKKSLNSSQEVRFRELNNYNDEYVDIENRVLSTLNCSILYIEKVENPFLWGCYLLKKKEYWARNINVKEELYFHCTSRENADKIIKDNFNWRKTKRSKFGKGVSFSPSAEYCNREANRNIGDDRVLILSRVLVGKSCAGHYGINVPPRNCDTTIGRKTVFVKYSDYEFYPTHIVGFE